MKNIHVLPTDKPSNLIHNVLGYGIINDEFTKSDLELIQAEFQNIYITSNKGIKEGNWCLELQTGKIFRAGLSVGTDYEDLFKKIILTDNKDLIKDGVQSIDDEFLEWFVKNPSCERVEVEKYHGINTSISEVNYIAGDGSLSWQGKNDLRDYKIIIPKEEPNPLTVGKEFYESADKNITVYRQETLEEAAENYSQKYSQKVGRKYGYMDGAEWQAERMYSEEEVIELLNKREDCINQTSSILDYTSAKEWFEQFKKK